jgi:hypothetical protein
MLSECSVSLHVNIPWEGLQYITEENSGERWEGEEVRTRDSDRIVRVLRSLDAPPRHDSEMRAVTRAWAERGLAPPAAVSQAAHGGYNCYKVSGTCHVDGAGEYRVEAMFFVANGYLYRIEELCRTHQKLLDVFDSVRLVPNQGFASKVIVLVYYARIPSQLTPTTPVLFGVNSTFGAKPRIRNREETEETEK